VYVQLSSMNQTLVSIRVCAVCNNLL